MNQYYRVHAVIDLDAICHNIREVKRVVGEGVKVMPVIKADGYGHGYLEVAKTLLENGADIHDIKEILGHADISSTQVYADYIKKRMKDSYLKFHPRA